LRPGALPGQRPARTDGPDHGRLAHADLLAQEIGFDIADHYTPDVPTYFSRISSAQIISSLCEAQGVQAAPAWGRMKKAELASLAARELATSRWLPEVLRSQIVCCDEAA
jgi:ParB family transcriptional regulator, chromosome partitioning protein